MNIDSIVTGYGV